MLSEHSSMLRKVLLRSFDAIFSVSCEARILCRSLVMMEDMLIGLKSLGVHASFFLVTKIVLDTF